RVVLVRFCELHEVTHGPRDHMLGALEKALLFLERALEHAREVPSHGGLLGDHKRLRHGGQGSGWANRLIPGSPFSSPAQPVPHDSVLTERPACARAPAMPKVAETVALATP